MYCTQGCGAIGRDRYVAWTRNVFPFGQLALNVRKVAVSDNNSYML